MKRKIKPLSPKQLVVEGLKVFAISIAITLVFAFLPSYHEFAFLMFIYIYPVVLITKSYLFYNKTSSLRQSFIYLLSTGIISIFCTAIFVIGTLVIFSS